MEWIGNYEPAAPAEQSSGITMLAMLPIAAWELSVGTWMLVKGFNPSPVTANLTKVD